MFQPPTLFLLYLQFIDYWFFYSTTTLISVTIIIIWVPCSAFSNFWYFEILEHQILLGRYIYQYSEILQIIYFEIVIGTTSIHQTNSFSIFIIATWTELTKSSKWSFLQITALLIFLNGWGGGGGVKDSAGTPSAEFCIFVWIIDTFLWFWLFNSCLAYCCLWESIRLRIYD